MRYSRMRKNGTTYPFEFSAIAVEQADNKQFVVIGSDISERLAREAFVRTSEERLRLALEGSTYGVLLWCAHWAELCLRDHRTMGACRCYRRW